MSKHKAKSKVRFIIVSAVLLLLVAGTTAGGYLVYKNNVQKNTASSKAQTKASQTVETLNLVGDQDLATTYIADMQAGKVASAQKLFSDRVAAESDIQKKIDLLTQNVLLALQGQHPDEALVVADRAIEVRAGEDTYALAARVYVAKADYGKQVEYWQKALDAVRASTVANKDQLITLYQGRIDGAVRAKALSERVN